jgi:hypothetical protein
MKANIQSTGVAIKQNQASGGAFGHDFGRLGGLAAGSAFLPAAAGALGAGAAAAPGASSSEALLGPAVGSVPSGLTTGAGATAAQGAAGGFSVIPGSTSLGGALEAAVGNAAGQSLIPGSLGTAGVTAGSTLSPAVQALLAGGAGAGAGAAIAPAAAAPVAPPVAPTPGFQVQPGLTQAAQIGSGAATVKALLGNGSGVTDEQLLTGQAPEAGGNPAGQVTPGFADQGAGPGGSGVPTGIPSVSAPGNIGGPGDALNRIVNGTATPGDYLTLGIPAGGALASLLAGANASSASKDAANAQLQASQAAIAEQRRQFDVTQANNAPFLATGTAANQRLSQLLGTAPGYTGTDAGSLVKPFTSADLNADPVYNSGLQFGLDEGTKAINARAIGAGNYDSGGTLKALTRYANDYGSTKANDAFNRYQTTQGNTFNRLSGVSGTGQTAVGQVAQAGQAATNNIVGSIADSGNARSAGIIGGSNAITGVANNLNSLANNFSSNQVLQALLAQRQPQTFSNG